MCFADAHQTLVSHYNLSPWYLSLFWYKFSDKYYIQPSNLQIFHGILMQSLWGQRKFLDLEKFYFPFLKS